MRRRGGGTPGGDGPPLRAPKKREPDPPRNEEAEQRSEPKRGECCVHGGEIVNPTLLPSGFVGCYKCVHGWVEERGTDPVVAEWSVHLDELRKINA